MATDLMSAPDEAALGEINKYDFVTPSHAAGLAGESYQPAERRGHEPGGHVSRARSVGDARRCG